MPVVRVHSSDCQVHINDQRLLGTQSCQFSTDKDFEILREIGEIGDGEKILKSNQTTNLDVSFLLTDVASGDPFFDFQTSGVLSVESFDFDIKDTAGQSQISGAYLTNYTLNASVGQIANGSAQFQADTIEFNNIPNTTQSDDSFDVFVPRRIHVGSDFGEGVSTTGLCVQSFNLSFSIDRESRNRLGQRIPQYRYPTLPTNGTLTFSILKNLVTGVDLSQIVLETGTFTLTMNSIDGDGVVYTVPQCALESISENLALDGNAMFDFSYGFPVNKLTRSRV